MLLVLAMLLMWYCRSSATAAAVTLRADTGSAALTLDEAIAQGIANSQRLAELAARAEAADFAIAGRRAAECRRSSRCRAATRAPTTSRSSRSTFPWTSAAGRLSRHSRQLPRPGSTCSGRSTPAAAATRWSAPRAPSAARSPATSRRRAPTCGSRSPARSGPSVTARETEDVVAPLARGGRGPRRRDVRARLAAGLVPPNDVSSAEAQASRQRLLAIEAATQRGIAEADLRRLTGNETRPPWPRRRLRRPAPAATPAPPVSELVAPRRASAAERQALEQRAASADAARRRGRGAARGRRSRSAAASTTRGPTRASFRAAASGRLVGRLGQRDVDAVGRRPPRRRARRSRAPAPPRSRRGSTSSTGR